MVAEDESGDEKWTINFQNSTSIIYICFLSQDIALPHDQRSEYGAEWCFRQESFPWHFVGGANADTHSLLQEYMVSQLDFNDLKVNFNEEARNGGIALMACYIESTLHNC